MADDIDLIRKGNLGIRHDGGKEQGMGTSAMAADNPADAKAEAGVAGFDCAAVVTVDGQTAGAPAGTGKPVELKRIDHVIINFLRNRIAKIDR